MEVRVETEALRDAAFLEIVGSLNSDRPVLSLVDVPQEQLVDLSMCLLFLHFMYTVVVCNGEFTKGCMKKRPQMPLGF